MTGCSLYRFFDANDRLLYVGITSAGPSRWSDHELHKAWWVLVVRTTVEHFDDRVTAAAAERAAILTEQPLHNIVHMKPPKAPAIGTKGKSGEGTVIERPDGRWAFVVRVDGKQRWLNTRTEAEARLLQAVWIGRDLPTATRQKAIAFLAPKETA